MLKKNLLAACAFFLFFQVQAQDLLSPSFSFSHKKTAYITLTDGTEVKGTIKDIDRKKGLIEEIKIKDENGKKRDFAPKEISFMYLPPSGLDNLTKALDAIHDVQKWSDEKLDQDLINQGYVYFETSNVKIKKKTSKMLMQLLNPSFSKSVKIYHDPLAKETMSVGVGAITVAGGNEKSYYISVAGATAYKLEKKNYKAEFTPLWKSCANVAKSYPEVKWIELKDHAPAFSKCE